MTEVYVYNADSVSVREAIASSASVRFDQQKLRKPWIGRLILQSLAINGGIVHTQLKVRLWQKQSLFRIFNTPIVLLPNT